MKHKQSVPKLALPSSPLDTWRSEDFQLPTSFRTTRRDEEPDEKLTDQLDRLNGIVQFVMGRFNPSEASTEAVEAEQRQQPTVCYRENLQMTVEDWLGHEVRTEAQPELFSTIEHVSAFLSPMKDQLLDLDFNDESRIHKSRHYKQDETNKLQLFIAYMARLKHDLANLTGQPFIAIKDQPEVELPVFCKQVLKIVGEVVTREKSISLSMIAAQEPHVKCSIDDLFDIRERIEDILAEVTEEGRSKEYRIQLGDFAVGLQVEIGEEMFASPQKPSRTPSEPQSSAKAEAKHYDYVRSLEVEVMELKAKLLLSEQAETSIFAGAQEARLMDLELQVEALGEELKLSQQQVWALSRASCNPDISAIIQESEKSDVVRQLEGLLMHELDSFKAEKYRLSEQARQIEVETSIVLQEQHAASDTVLREIAAELEQHQAIEEALKQRIHQLENEVDTLRTPDLCQGVHHRRDSGTWMEVSQSQSVDKLNKRLSECYSKLENHDPQMGPPSAIRREIKEIRSKLDVLQTKEALQAVELCIENTDLNLKKLERECISAKSKSLRTTCDITNTSDRYQEQLTFRSSEQDRLNSERAGLTKALEEFNAEKAKFEAKKGLLKQKINKVNERQHKLVEREKLLAEKQTLLLLQEKKQDCHKQAIDEEWARIDEKRHEVLKCHRMMDEEWTVLMEETRAFELVKQQDRKAQAELNVERQRLQTQLNEIESSRLEQERFKVQLKENSERLEKRRELLEREMSKIAQEREILSYEKEKLKVHKTEVFTRIKDLELEQKDCSFERLQLTQDRRKVEKSKRDMSLLMPCVKKGLGRNCM